MTQYLIAFHQEWVGEHPEAWFRERGALVRAVVEEMKAAGVHVFAGGVEEDREAGFSVDPTSGAVVITPGPYRRDQEHLGGLTIVDVADDEAAKTWAGRVAEACGWPQEVRRLWT